MAVFELSPTAIDALNVFLGWFKGELPEQLLDHIMAYLDLETLRTDEEEDLHRELHAMPAGARAYMGRVLVIGRLCEGRGRNGNSKRRGWILLDLRHDDAGRSANA